MPARKEDEIMAEYLLKGGKMLEKACKTCGCPLFEVKGKTLCVVCAENEPAKDAKNVLGGKKPAAPAAAEAGAATLIHDDGHACSCGEDHDEDSCTCGDGDGGLAEELAFTIHSLCERIQNEKDPENVLLLMNAVKEGTEALEILCKL
ncbi:MAG TPA: Sjogren's syndrome/scleroderma autoantigen 1 family protein [Methanoregula sp.]|nr:Sjogren's syndrome/scleroderma autoantigen 1 family protein [Methanoregula sp.]